MTRGEKVLRALMEKGALKKFCAEFGVSARQCEGVADGLRKPTWDLMNALRPIVPARAWFEEAE